MKMYLYDRLYTVGSYIIEHAESISTHRENIHQRRHLLSPRSNKCGIILAAISAMAMQAEKSHWEY